VNPILVADVQAALAVRCGAMLTAAGLDGSATSPLYLEGIATSVRELGLPLLSAFTVVDADLAAVTQAQASQLLDVAEWSALGFALNAAQFVDMRIGDESVSGQQLALTWQATIARKADYIKERYGIGLGSLGALSVDLGFDEPCWPAWPDGWTYP
jgi:hypothetical protein